VNLPRLALRNALARNPTRASLTILATAAAAIGFLFLRTVLSVWYSSSEASASDRVITRNAISFTQPLPLAHVEKVKQVPGVTSVTFSNWFGGVYKDPKYFFARYAVDARSATEVYELKYVEGSRAAFEQDRNSCLLGKNLAEKYGIKIGDEVPLQGDIYPGEWRFKVAALIEAEDASIASSMFFHWTRLNDGLPEARKNQIGVITSKVARADDSPRVIKAIDEVFANSPFETRTETEKSFRLGFVSSSAAILSALEALSYVILVIMALILGNTLAMGLRERTAELGAMRAIGFLPWHVAALSMSEGAILGLLGGLCAVAISKPLLTTFGRFMNSLGFLSGIGFQPGAAALTLSLSVLLGVLAAAWPALSAARLPVTDALRRQE
jgi:putative ABC transport system permease protein